MHDQTINCFDFALKSLEIYGKIEIFDLKRVVPLLAATDGVVSYRLVGSRDVLGCLRIDLTVNAVVDLECQRCLSPYEYKVESLVHFRVFANESELPVEDDEENASEYLVGSEQVSVIGLVEDEMLLSLPYAPAHDEGGCEVEAALLASEKYKEKEHKPNPFSVLKDWGKNKDSAG
jgi:uncharacterized protein